MSINKSPLAASLFFTATLVSLNVIAQDSSFMACAQFTDRGERIACLEDALDAAIAEQAPANAQANTPAPVQPTVLAPHRTEPVAASVTENTAPATSDDAPSLLDRLRNFGQSDSATSISSDDEGNDQLHDTITALEKRNNLLVVTLASGQVWQQQVARRLNLREGDEITIYQAGIGNGYRLATARLSGFIRVERVK